MMRWNGLMPHILQNPTIFQHSDSKNSANPKFTSSRNPHFPMIHIFPKFTFFQNSPFSKVHIFPKFTFFQNSHKFTFFQNSHFFKIHVFQEIIFKKKLNSSSQFTIQRIHTSQSTKFLQKSIWLHKHNKTKKFSLIAQARYLKKQKIRISLNRVKCVLSSYFKKSNNFGFAPSMARASQSMTRA